METKMSIALTLMRQRNAVSAQKAVTDTTNNCYSRIQNFKAKCCCYSY